MLVGSKKKNTKRRGKRWVGEREEAVYGGEELEIVGNRTTEKERRQLSEEILWETEWKRKDCKKRKREGRLWSPGIIYGT